MRSNLSTEAGTRATLDIQLHWPVETDADRLRRVKEDLRRAAFRGVTKDLLGAYGRLLAYYGRTMSPTAPRLSPSGALLVPFSAVPQRDREALLDREIGSAMGNPTHGPSWDSADATIKGWALAEGVAMRQWAAAAYREAAAADVHGEDGDAEECRRIGEIRDRDADHFMALASASGWR